MLLTSWIRALRQSFTRRRRVGHARRQPADVRRQAAGHSRLVEVLEERSLLSIRPLVIDINTVTNNNQFTSTATSPGISITNSTLDPNNDGISDYDDLVIGVSQSSPTQTAFESTVISGAGIGIRINLSNLTGLNHISIDNVSILAGANQQGISVVLDNVALQSLVVDQTTISATSGTLTAGLDVSLKNMSSVAGVDVSVQNSTIRTGSAAANGINVSLESVSKATHVGELTLTDSTVEGVNVATSANSILYATIDQASARNNRIQDGAANPAARGITYTLNRTTVGDLRIEKNLNLRNVAVTTTNSPLQTVSISDNPFDVRGFVAADVIRDAIRINATSTNAVGTQHSDVTNLRISGNTITGSGLSAVNSPTVNGIVLALTDSNLGDYAVASAGATVINNTIRSLSSGSSAATGISITASASAAFVTGNGDRPLLLDFDGDGTANDLNGITSNTLAGNNGRGLVVATQANTTFLADISSNSIDGNINGVAAANRREGVSLVFTDKPTNAGFDSFNVNFLSNTINNGTGTALGVTLQNTAIGSFVIQDNQILNTRDSVSSNPDGLAVVLQGTSVTQEATNILRKSFISGNFIGLTKPATGVPSVAAANNGNGLFINTQEQSSIQDLHIENNVIQNSRQNGLSFLREDQSTLRTVNPDVGQNRAITISGNTIGLSTQDGIHLDARNGSTDLLDFEIRNNFIGTDSADPTSANNLVNGGDGIELVTQADARLLADLDGNTIRFNVGNGIQVRDVFGDFTTDKRQIGGTWINNTISNNTLSGIVIRGRHGLFDELTGITTPLVIGLEGQGNTIESNLGNGIRINEPLRDATGTIIPGGAIPSIAVGQVSITNNLIRGNSANNLANEIGPSRAGIFIHSADEKVDIRHNQIESNFGKGIDIEVVHGIPTLPTNLGLPGNVEVTIRDNVITDQRASGNEQGDGVELSNFEPNRVFSGVRSNNSALNRLDVLALNNFIDSNAGRGVDVLNIANGTMQLRFGDDTESGRNTIVGNALDGFRAINTGDPTQTTDGLPTAANPLGTPTAVQSAEALNSPDMMLDVSRNTIRDNGINMPAPVQNGGVSQVNGTGFVLLAAGVGFGSSVVASLDPLGLGFADNTFAAIHPNEVGVNSGDPLLGNGRVNLRVTDNSFEGNFGNDLSIVPYIAVIPPQTQTPGDGGSWPVPPTTFAITSMVFDPLVRINAVVTGNTGNGLDVIRAAPDYTNDETYFKSRSTGGGPFGSGTRPRNATRLASDGDPTFATPGYSFVYPGVDEGANNVNRQTGNGSLTAQATTLRIESGFDRSGTTQGFAFFDPAAPGPGSDDNFDDPFAGIVNGRIDTQWDSVVVNSFTYPNVDSPTSLRSSVTPFTTPRGSTPGVITVNFSEFVQFVDITDFRLLRNGVVVPLESSPGVALAVSPVAASQDPNNPGAFSSFTIDLTAVTSVAGDYDLQVLVVDPSNPTFTAIRDVHLQLSNQGNTLIRVIDGDGVLQDFALDHQFTVDLNRPVATISPITPDPRNSAAGIVTVTFNEDVTGVDISDFALYRTVGVTTSQVNLGSISVTQISASQYTLNLNQLSGAPGDYELQVVSSDPNTPVFDLAGNLVAEIDAINQIAASDTWTVDTTLPFITSIADSLLTTTITSPINAHPSSIILNFSETVLGVGVSDFSLVRTNADGTVTNIDISSFPLFLLAGNQYELNLGLLATVAGTYQFTINPLNSGITDVAGNAFLTSASASWVLDVAAPTADVVDVAPDPRQTPVDALNTIFSEAVTGVNLAVGGAATHYVLSYDDGTPATSAAITDATNAGPIIITSNNHGLANGDQITVFGVLGNLTANGVFVVQNRTANTFELAGSVGSGLYSGGGRWARTVSLAGFTISQQSSTRFVLNLSSVTLPQGTYIVSLLSNSGITDLALNPVGPHTDALGVQDQFNVSAQDIWINGPDAAPTGSFSTITSPRGTNAGVVTVTFSEPLAKINNASPVDFKDFKLFRGVTEIVLTSTNVPINQTGPTTYSLDLTAAGITDIDGTYTLQLRNTDTTGATATPLRDLTGNLLSDDSDPLTATGIASQVIWTKDSTLSGPQVTSFLDVQRSNALGSITKLRAVQTLEITFDANVSGVDLTDASKNFLLTRQTAGGAAIPVSLDSVPVQPVNGPTGNKYRLNLSTLTGTDGTYRLTVLANGLIKNTSTLVDLKNPQTVTWTKDGTIRPSASASDSVDTNQGNEVVGSGSNYSLRQAVQEANALAGDDVIQLEGGTLAAPKIYTLTLAGVQEDFASVGDLDIRENLIIRGRGVGVTIIDASALANQVTVTNRDRVFQILAGVTNATIQGVTIQNGAVTGSEDGGAIRNSGVLTILDSLIQNSTSQDDGGAINNTGTLTINRTTVSNNIAVATGGAIRNAGTLNLLNSTLNGNRSTGNGGGLMNVAGGTALLEGVTVSTNTSTSGSGGGIRNDGTLTLINDTIASNRSLNTGAGLSRNLGTVTIANTIVSDNQLTNLTNNDVAGAFVSRGGNVIRTLGTATGFAGPQDQLNVNPNLLVLGNYGGPTQTHAIPSTSVAVDAGLNAQRSADTFDLDGDGDTIELTPFDQRGALRVLNGPAVGNAVDVGAVEFGTFFVNTTVDTPDINPGDGLAEDGLQRTSLRAAIMESNTLAGESAVMLDGAVYLLNRLSPDTTAPTVTSMLGVPLAPTATTVGLVTINFSEAVGKISPTITGVLANAITAAANVVTLTSVVGFPLAAPFMIQIGNEQMLVTAVAGNSLTVTRGINGTTAAAQAANAVVSLVSLRLTRDTGTGPVNVSLAGLPITKVSDSQYTINLTTVTGTNGKYTLTVETSVTDAEGNRLAAPENVNWVRGVDTFAPTFSITPNPIVSNFITNAGNVIVTFSEKVNGVSANNFSLTLNGTPVNGLVVTPVSDNNFGGRTVVTLNLTNLTAAVGNYVLTLNPVVGASTTIKDTANNNLAAGQVLAWSKAAGVRFEPINNPRVDELKTIRLQFTEKVAGVKLEDFTLTYDDGTIVGPQNVDLSQATLTTVGAVVATTSNGNAAEQWELTFSNKQAARDGAYTLNFDGLTNGNVLVTSTNLNFVPTNATLPFQIGEDSAAIGDLDIIVGADRVQIFGKGRDDSKTVLGNDQPRTVIDGNMTDRLFDLAVSSNVSIDDVEMIHGKVVYERNGGAIRNFGTLTVNDADVGTINGLIVQANVADGNGGGISNSAPTAPVTDSLQAAVNAVLNTLTLNSVSTFSLTTPFVIQVDSEQMRVTAVNVGTNQFTVVRGINGTTAAAHAANATVNLIAAQVGIVGALQAAATNVAGTLTLVSVAAFPTNVPYLIQIDSEQIQVTAVNVAANQLTVSRGFNGTTAAAHAIGAEVNLLSSTTLNRTNVQYNTAGSAASSTFFGKGGAVFNEVGALVVNEGNFSQNLAMTDGGALYNGNSATMTLLSATVSTNSAGRDGGAVYNNDTAVLTVTSGTLSGNKADTTVNGVTPDGDGDGGAIYNETSAKLFLDDSLLQNNSARNGGALYNDDGTLVLNRNEFGLNSALENGGAVFNTTGGNITLNKGLFTTNTASDNGGAIQNYGTLTLLDVGGTGTQFLSNEAGTDVRAGDADDGVGGAIFNQDGVLTISSATFTLNRSHGNAGVIFNDGDSALTISRTTFDRNTSDQDGGVLYNNDFSQLTIDESTFSNNTSGGDGGAIFNNSEFTSGSSVSLTVDDSTFNSNTSQRGGAIFNSTFGGLALTNSTLSANQASLSGGGLENYGSATLLNATVYLNDGPIAAGIASNLDGSSPLAAVSLKNTIVAGGIASADLGGFDSNFVDAGHNLIEDVGTIATAFSAVASANILGQNPQLDVLRNNGGPTQTHFLLFGSPARDAGDNFAVTDNDQRGLNRIFDGDGNGVATVDIGSVESGFVVNSFLDTVDQNPGDGINADEDGQSTLRAAVMEANARSGEDTIILGPGLFQLTLTGRAEDFRLNSFGNIASGSETGDLDILDNLNIIGAGTDLTFIDAAQIDRIFQVFPGVILNLSNLTLQNGDATSTDFGGAILNQGQTSLDNVLVLDSTAGRGGGVYNNVAVVGSLSVAALATDGTITLTSAAAFNTATPFQIQIDSEVLNVTAVNTTTNVLTVSRAQSGTTAAAHAVGANVTILNSGSLTITNSLFRGNLAVQQGGALYNNGTLTLGQSDIGVASRLAAAIASTAATTITVSDASGFPTATQFVIQVDAERMLVTAVAGKQFTVTRGFNGTVATTHTASAFATLGNFANVHGGGLFNLGAATIDEVSFNGNLAESRGGGVYNAALSGTLSVAATAAAGTLTLGSVSAFPTTSVPFTIQVDNEKMTVTAVNVAANTLTVARGVAGTAAAAHSVGAFVTSVGEVTLEIEQTTFLDNFASSRGAAVFNEENLTIKNSTISNNDAGANAALANTVSGDVFIDNTTVVDNVAYRGGGLSNSLIGSVVVQNTIVANNASTTITGVKAPNVRGTFVTATNNFIGNNADSSGFTNALNFDQVGSGTSPFDPVLKALADNGGLTQTHATRTGSPVIDTGDNTGGDAFDQRGAIRPTNGDSDIGAVEQQDIRVSINNNLQLKEGNSGSTLFTFTLSLNKTSVQEIRVHYTLQGDTAFAGEDFIDATGDVVFAPNQLNQTLVVVVNGDTTVEIDERFLVNLSIPSDALFTPTLVQTQAIGTILSDDTGIRITDVNKVEGESGSQIYTFDVSVVGALLVPGQTVAADYTIVDGSARSTANLLDPTDPIDYSLIDPTSGTLMFTADATGLVTTVRQIRVQVNADQKSELNENFFVNLTSLDLPFEFGKDKGVGTIFNDDLSFSISNASANEGDPVSTTPMTFTVTLDRPVYVTGVGGTPTQATAAVTVATASATATSGQDFTAVNTTLSFIGTTITQTVDVQIIGDLRYEKPDETFQLQVTAGTINATADVNVVSLSTSGTGTIVDNDSPPDQYHIYTYLNSGDGQNHIRVDRIQTVAMVATRTMIQDVVQAGAPMISQSGDFGGVATDDLFAVDFNLYDSGLAADFALYDTTGVIDPAHVLGVGNPVPATGLSVDGLDQFVGGADTTRFQGGGTFTAVTYNSTGPGSGSVTFDGSVVTYAGLEPILDDTDAISREFFAPLGVTNDKIAVSSSGGFISISSVITTGAPTFESITARSPSNTLIINGNSGDNTIQINSADLTFTAALTVNGGDGADTINLSGWSLLSTINGGLGVDNITGGSNNDLIDGGDGADIIDGGLGNDVIFGGLGNDNITAGGGDDVVDGGNDDDVIQGNDGVDNISGGDGKDNIDGGAGSDTVDGGLGDDIVAGGDDPDTVLGNDGNDQLSGGNGVDSLDGGFGDDTMSGDAGNDFINGQNDSDVVKYTDTLSAGNATITLTSGSLTITQGTTTIEVDTLVNAERALLIGGNGNNKIDASTPTPFAGSVTMLGGGGSDTLLGGDGDDCLVGGAGSDTLTGGIGNDTLRGGDGTATLVGDLADTITGGAGDDNITGDAGNDTIDGGDGNDSALGGDSNDSITGGIGIDTLDGGNGQDTLFGQNDGDSLLGGAGQDMLDGGNGADTIDGGDGDDTAFGQADNDDVRGGAGNDTLEGNLGDDSVNGMDGNDTLNGSAGDDTLFGGSGDDELISTEGNDQLLGQGGSGDKFTFDGDNSTTDPDNFTITTYADPNPGTGRVGIGLARLNPLKAFTTVLLGVEVFTLNLNSGNDLVTLADLVDVNDLTILNINGGEGNDTIDGSLSTSTTVLLRALMGNGNDSVLGTAGNDIVQGEAGNDTIIAGVGTDSLVGGDGNDSLNGNSDNDTINGGLGDDSIWGGGGSDLLTGLDGRDTIWGQAGSDTIDGGIDDDFLDGGYGDSVTAGSGDDSIRGGFGNDKIAGRDGADKLFGDDGNDTITGGDGIDVIDAGTGNDLVNGDGGNDTINGGAGNDFLLGGDGDDSILGGSGNDTLVGGLGKDTVDGQGGTDTVLGGSGTGTNTLATGEKRVGEKINELFKITSARSSIFNELNF